MMRFSLLTARLKVIRRPVRRWCCRGCAAGRRQRLFRHAAVRHHLVRSWWCSKYLMRSALIVGRAALLDRALAHDVRPGVAVVDIRSGVAFACLTHGVEVRLGWPLAFRQVNAVVIE